MVIKISKKLAIFLAVLMICGTLSVAQVRTAKALSEDTYAASQHDKSDDELEVALQGGKTKSVNVKDFKGLKKEIDKAPKDKLLIINVIKDIIFTSEITVNANTDIIIQSNSDKKLIQNSGRHFKVKGDATLKLGSGIILDGGNSGGGIHNSRGTLNVTTNATIQNCKAGYGGAILNDCYGTVTIDGKVIRAC